MRCGVRGSEELREKSEEGLRERSEDGLRETEDGLGSEGLGCEEGLRTEPENEMVFTLPPLIDDAGRSTGIQFNSIQSNSITDSIQFNSITVLLLVLCIVKKKQKPTSPPDRGIGKSITTMR